VAGLLARLAQIKQQREALDKEEQEVLARLREELPREHKALQKAEQMLKEYEGAAGEKGGARNARGGKNDASTTALFNSYAQGQDHININQVQNPADPALRFRLMQFAQREKITNGRLDRDQFAKFMREETKRRPGSQGGVPGGAPTPSSQGQKRGPGQQ
jgi:hypothetical protein